MNSMSEQQLLLGTPEDDILSGLEVIESHATDYVSSGETYGDALEVGIFGVPLRLEINTLGKFTNNDHEAELRLCVQPRKGTTWKGLLIDWELYGMPQHFLLATKSDFFYSVKRMPAAWRINLNGQPHGWRPTGASWFLVELRYTIGGISYLQAAVSLTTEVVGV